VSQVLPLFYLCHLLLDAGSRFCAVLDSYELPSDFTPVIDLKKYRDCPTSNSFLSAECAKTFGASPLDGHRSASSF